MGAKWFWGILILAIASLLWALFTAPNRSEAMGTDIQNALNNAGYTSTQVDMNGNVATLAGVAASEKTRGEIGAVAENAKCSSCGGKKTWHKVVNSMTVKKAPALPTQSPYTFDAIKDVDGNVVINGYVRSEEERKRILAKANATFPGKVTDRTVRIALGQPNADWENVIDANFDELMLLNSGRFTMENATSFISGQAATADIRDRINAMVGGLPSGYNGAANITVPNMEAVNVGELTSEGICQTLLDDLKTGKKINFAYNRAEIRGAPSFDLLNSIASAAKQCASFRIGVEGHTDSDGGDDYNQHLSEDRANTVLAYLSENGIAVDRMAATGFGETNPVGDNSTPEGRAQNRRIEFVVTQSE
jgi:OOP family OmpA-OmpF porin